MLDLIVEPHNLILALYEGICIEWVVLQKLDIGLTVLHILSDVEADEVAHFLHGLKWPKSR